MQRVPVGGVALTLGWLLVLILTATGPGSVDASTFLPLGVAGTTLVVGATTTSRRVAAASFLGGILGFAVFWRLASAIPNTRGDEWFWSGLGFWVPAEEVWLSSMVPMRILWAVGSESFVDLNVVSGSATVLLCGLLGAVLQEQRGESTFTWQGACSGAAVFGLTAAPTLFVLDYHETYPTAAVFAMGAVVLISATPAEPGPLWAAASGAASGLAAVFHGQYLVLVVVSVVVLTWRSRRLPGALLSLLSSLLVIAVTVTSVPLSGASLATGNASGMADGPFDLGYLDVRKWSDLAVIATVVVAGALPFIAVALVHPRDDRFGAASVLAAGTLLFWTTWGFDYGFPLDLDLATSALWGVLPLAVLGLRVVITLDRRLARTIGVASILVTSVVLSTYVMPADDYPADPEIVVPTVRT